jgi:hypothetical protein
VERKGAEPGLDDVQVIALQEAEGEQGADAILAFT